MRGAATTLAAFFCLSAVGVSAVEVRRQIAGRLSDRTMIEAVTLANGQGVSARILSYGATLQSLMAPDRQGRINDVVLGYDDLHTYVDHPNYFGATIGRDADRIAGGRFTLYGSSYQLPLNDKTNSLHGGGKRFNKQVRRVAAMTSGPAASVAFTCRSPDGEAGYPGNLDVTVTYSLDERGDLRITLGRTLSS